MNPIELAQNPWAFVIVLILGIGTGLRILHASVVRREKAMEKMLAQKTSAEAELYQRMAAAFEATSAAVTKRMEEIVGLIHANEKMRVHDDRDMETRLMQEIRAAMMGTKQDLLREMRNVRIDIRRGATAERVSPSEEQEIVDMLHDSSPPEGHDPAVLLGERR